MIESNDTIMPWWSLPWPLPVAPTSADEYQREQIASANSTMPDDGKFCDEE